MPSAYSRLLQLPTPALTSVVEQLTAAEFGSVQGSRERRRKLRLLRAELWRRTEHTA